MAKMMKILVVSDTHGYLRNFISVIEKIGKLDYVFHLGDVEGGEEDIRNLVDCPVEFVAGNNDYYSKAPKEKIITLNGYKILLCHGHAYFVNYNLNHLKEIGKNKNVNLILFGHTHIPIIEHNNLITLMNPGSISYPRQPKREPSYGVLDLEESGVCHFTINYLKKV